MRRPDYYFSFSLKLLQSSWLLILGALAVGGQPTTAPLGAGTSLERELPGGETHIFPVALTTGQFLQ
jgi:hypothetical protein